MSDELPIVYLKIRAGWCALTMKVNTSEITVRSHHLGNDLKAFIGAGAALGAGVTTQSISWLRELSEGYFVDFVQSPGGILSIVVCKNFASDSAPLGQIEPLENDPPYREWWARRGEVVFDETVDAVAFLKALEGAAHEIRGDIDASGNLLEWDHKFPEDEFRELRYALRRRAERGLGS